MHPTPPRAAAGRPGVAYVLAMLYLMLFTVLAIGFCAAGTMSMQISRNDRSAADAQAAAESGMQFIRHELSRLSIPAMVPDGNLAQEIAGKLGQELNGSPSLNGHELQISGPMIYLPSENEWTASDPAIGTRFRVQITTAGESTWVKVIGRGNDESITRAIQMRFKLTSRPGGSRLVADAASYEEVSP